MKKIVTPRKGRRAGPLPNISRDRDSSCRTMSAPVVALHRATKNIHTPKPLRMEPIIFVISFQNPKSLDLHSQSDVEYDDQTCILPTDTTSMSTVYDRWSAFSISCCWSPLLEGYTAFFRPVCRQYTCISLFLWGGGHVRGYYLNFLCCFLSSLYFFNNFLNNFCEVIGGMKTKASKAKCFCFYFSRPPSLRLFLYSLLSHLLLKHSILHPVVVLEDGSRNRISVNETRDTG